MINQFIPSPGVNYLPRRWLPWDTSEGPKQAFGFYVSALDNRATWVWNCQYCFFSSCCWLKVVFSTQRINYSGSSTKRQEWNFFFFFFFFATKESRIFIKFWRQWLAPNGTKATSGKKKIYQSKSNNENWPDIWKDVDHRMVLSKDSFRISIHQDDVI